MHAETLGGVTGPLDPRRLVWLSELLLSWTVGPHVRGLFLITLPLPSVKSGGINGSTG